MPVCPSCERLVIRNELFEGKYRCKFADCNGVLLGRSSYPVLGAETEEEVSAIDDRETACRSQKAGTTTEK